MLRGPRLPDGDVEKLIWDNKHNQWADHPGGEKGGKALVEKIGGQDDLMDWMNERESQGKNPWAVDDEVSTDGERSGTGNTVEKKYKRSYS